MDRLLAILAIALTATFAGCIDAGRAEDATTTPGSSGSLATEGGHGDASVTTTQDLGSASGSTLQPSRFDFTVTVPEGGATNVRWDLSIETTSDSLLQRVEGPGCGSTGLLVVLVGSATFGGHCDDLSPGEHQFTAVLDSPAVSFSAVVRGQATVVTTW
jgi:hypothetical protein